MFTTVAHAFTQITVVGPATSVDVSIPEDVTVAEIMRLIGGPGEDQPQQWVLHHPVKGSLTTHISLRAAGVLDGEKLYLRPAEEGSLAPYAEDAAEEAAALADATPGAWTPDLTRAASTVLLAAWLGLLGPAMLWRFGATPRIAGILAVVTAIVAGGGIAARRLTSTTFATGLAIALIALSGSLGGTLAGAARLESAVMACCGAVAVGVAVAVAGWLAPSLRAAYAGIGAAALLTAVWTGATALGLPSERSAAVSALLGAAATGLLPRLAVEGAGLGRAADEVSTGAAVRRGEVRRIAQRARTSLVWLLIGVAVPAAAALVVLTTGTESGIWPQAYAATVAAVFWLRSRAYSHASHIVVLLCAGAVGAFAVAFAAFRAAEEPAIPTVVALIAAAILGACAITRLGEITRIRLRTLLDRIELLALIACGPLLLGVFDAYAWATRLGGG